MTLDRAAARKRCWQLAAVDFAGHARHDLTAALDLLDQQDAEIANLESEAEVSDGVLDMIRERLSVLGCCHPPETHAATPPMSYDDWIACCVARREQRIQELDAALRRYQEHLAEMTATVSQQSSTILQLSERVAAQSQLLGKRAEAAVDDAGITAAAGEVVRWFWGAGAGGIRTDARAAESCVSIIRKHLLGGEPCQSAK